MRIVHTEEFLKLPKNTLFATYTPHCFGELMIKMDTMTSDWSEQAIIEIESEGSSDLWDKLEGAEENGDRLELDLDCCGRDGMFDDEAMFAVFDSKDVQQIINRLHQCVKGDKI